MASGINLFVAPLDKNIDDAIFRQRFAQFGELFSASVAKDEVGLSKGFGFVHFVSMEDGVRAMREMNGKTWLSREIHVDVANTQQRSFGEQTPARTSIWASELVTQPDHDVEDTYSTTSETIDDLNFSGTSDIKERMKKLFKTQSYCDVTFYPKNNRKVSISGHRAVLAIGSPLFTKMLYDDQSKDTAGMKMEVEISNLSFGAFTNIVNYLYTDEVFFESDAQAHDILQGAKEFDIPPLVSRCMTHFETLQLTSQNVCSKLQMSISSKIAVLKDRCLEFIKDNTLQVIGSDDFLHCSPSAVRAICNLPSLRLRSEVELLKAVMDWSLSQPTQNRKQSIQALLKCFRFLTFTVEQLGDTLKTYPDLLTSEEGLKIMLYLYNPPKTPDSSSLPTWCNKNTQNRCCFTDRPHVSSAISTTDMRTYVVGRVQFPLKTNRDLKPLSSLTSLLQMRCVSGMHQIRAIRLAFQPPVTVRSIIGRLSISLHVHPSGFRTSEEIQVGNSESVRVELGKVVKVRSGNLLDIEVEARDVRSYQFLKFDDEGRMPYSPHFQCCVSSRPKEGKMYFISEIEYGPQQAADKPFARSRRARSKN